MLWASLAVINPEGLGQLQAIRWQEAFSNVAVQIVTLPGEQSGGGMRPIECHV
ncbi:hypothetical protein CfE428DRAFT_0403 [Chthoniobacter flavus Ellin428]|uniref:Uncharacterized protein n=1 Tax=Chthoniobacter flavus Ellin428 TaxID=497964 RepID=B4CUP0_9BACT|nr:hypothetical protein CfE428DRAFT_0403 [Chthoniobacter flavus Ellin428]